MLMRTDMNSLTPGRACAQAAHAQSEFEYWARIHSINLASWKNDRIFGTVIVLRVDPNDSLTNWESKITELELFWGTVIDPKYPIQDGIITHYVKDIPTCTWVYCNKENGDKLFGNLKLY